MVEKDIFRNPIRVAKYRNLYGRLGTEKEEYQSFIGC